MSDIHMRDVSPAGSVSSPPRMVTNMEPGVISSSLEEGLESRQSGGSLVNAVVTLAPDMPTSPPSSSASSEDGRAAEQDIANMVVNSLRAGMKTISGDVQSQVSPEALIKAAGLLQANGQDVVEVVQDEYGVQMVRLTRRPSPACTSKDVVGTEQQDGVSLQYVSDITSTEQGANIAFTSPTAISSKPVTSSLQVISPTSSTPGVQGVDAERNCLICGDRGSGYHYSAFSCEGCKGFFKRTIQKMLSYACKGGGDCVINKFTRNSCQHCRFRKCTEVGMKKEAVREDRSPGGKHRHKRQRVEAPSHAQQSPAAPQSEKPAFHTNLIDALVDAKPFLVPKVDSTITLDCLTLNELMQYGYMELRYIIEWAKKVPGFKGLRIDDQMALLKSSFMELNVLRLSYRSMELEDSIKFAEGLIVPIDYASSIGWGKELIAATAEFATRLRDISMDATEFCMLNAIVLTYPDAVGIQDKQQVTELQTQMLDSLRRYMSHTYPDDHRRYGKMLLRLPALRTVSAKAAERFLSLSIEGSIQLSALVSEMMT